MPFYRVNGTMMHLKLAGPKSRHPKPCVARIPADRPGTFQCCAISTRLCDWPVEGGTCDAPLCAEHATEIGPDRHLCPAHAQRQTEAAPTQPDLF